jgi:L-ascorbate metabolism protein UlaG (beta-lactamase superfamily)
MQITWFGHSCFRLDTGTSSILIDPFLTGNATFEDSGLTVHGVAKGVTHVALTHGHDDHTGNAVAICKESGATLIAVFELAMHVAGLGVVKVDPGNTGGTLYHEDFDLSFVPAWHPHIGFVPIGDRFTMGATTAALACKRYFQFETIVPCHYGTFPMLDQTAGKFVAERGGNTVGVPKVGVPFQA